MILRLSALFLTLSIACVAAPLHALRAETPSATAPLTPVSVAHPFAPPAATWLPGHRGVDLLGRPGQLVRAPLDGTVVFAGTIGAKPVLSIDHGGFRTTYEPVISALTVGDTVTQGQTIGMLQTYGGHCLPATCLHWGLIISGEYADPLSLLGPIDVRLLPLDGSTPAPLGSTSTVVVRPWDGPVGRPYATDPW